MRRPAQHHPATGWSHPYTGTFGLAVFHADGGNGTGEPQSPPVPSPADVAQRAQAQPPAPQQPAPQYVLDRETGEPMLQDKFTRIMTREGVKGRNKALRPIFEAAGLAFDHDNPDTEKLAQLLKDAEQARQAALSDEQRRSEEFDRQQQELQDGRAQLEQAKAELAEQRRTVAREQALTRLGASDVLNDKGEVTDPHLQEALALLDWTLRETPDADAAQIAAAAAEVKKRHPALFGGIPAPQTLPPAPSGAPAGGNLPTQPTPGKDALQQQMRQKAIDMGLRRPDAA